MNAVLTHDFEPAIRSLFSTDEALISTFHIASGTDSDTCASKTIADLKLAHPSFEFFTIQDQGKVIAFFGKEHDQRDFLNTIFIHPEYRTKALIPLVWSVISSHFSKPFWTALYEKNSRAIGFYLRQGGEIIQSFNHDGHPAVAIQFKESVCR